MQTNDVLMQPTSWCSLRADLLFRHFAERLGAKPASSLLERATQRKCRGGVFVDRDPRGLSGSLLSRSADNFTLCAIATDFTLLSETSGKLLHLISRR